MIDRTIIPTSNSLLFLVFIYFALEHFGIDQLTPYFLFSFIASVILIMNGFNNKLGSRYFFLSFFPLLVTLVIAFLLFTGIGLFLLMLLGFYGPTPN